MSSCARQPRYGFHYDFCVFVVDLDPFLYLQWDVISRRWRQRKNVQMFGLLIADEVQMVGGEVGPTYEVVIS